MQGLRNVARLGRDTGEGRINSGWKAGCGNNETISVIGGPRVLRLVQLAINCAGQEIKGELSEREMGIKQLGSGMCCTRKDARRSNCKKCQARGTRVLGQMKRYHEILMTEQFRVEQLLGFNNDEGRSSRYRRIALTSDSSLHYLLPFEVVDFLDSRDP